MLGEVGGNASQLEDFNRGDSQKRHGGAGRDWLTRPEETESHVKHRRVERVPKILVPKNVADRVESGKEADCND